MTYDDLFVINIHHRESGAPIGQLVFKDREHYEMAAKELV